MCSQDRSITSLALHHARPRPGKRRPSRKLACRRHTIPLTILYSTVLFLLMLCTTAVATESMGRDTHRYTLAQLARKGEILIDRRPAPCVDLHRRQAGDSSASTIFLSSTSTLASFSSSAASSTPSTIVAPSSSTVTAALSTASLMTVSSSTPDSPLPSPFDTSLGNNFTSSSCPAFFNSFLGNSTFKSCLPFSLLLQVSCYQSPSHQSILTNFADRTPTLSSQPQNQSSESLRPSTLPAMLVYLLAAA